MAKWLPEQVECLRKYYGLVSREELETMLGKTSGAILSRVRTEKIRCPAYTVRDVVSILGISMQKVERYIKKGYLKAQRQVSYDHAKSEDKRWWILQDDAIIKFINKYFLLYDPSLVDSSWQKYIPYEEIGQWVSLVEVSKQYHFSKQWFRGLNENGFVRFRWGRTLGGKKACIFVYIRDVDFVLANGDILKPFRVNAQGKAKNNFKKGAVRGWGAVPARKG